MTSSYLKSHVRTGVGGRVYSQMLSLSQPGDPAYGWSGGSPLCPSSSFGFRLQGGASGSLEMFGGSLETVCGVLYVFLGFLGRFVVRSYFC